MRKTTSWAAIVLALCTGVGALESPAELLALKMKTQLLTQTEGTMTWEGVCWHASRRAGDFVGAPGRAETWPTTSPSSSTYISVT
ncbi:MAG: hypothetical protein VCE12_02750 [Candidatus Latescibacterota bacterium]